MAVPKAWVLILVALLLFGCERTPAPEAGQGKGPERPAESITHFGLHTELFVEFPALVKGEASPFAAHLTRLDTFKAVAQGRVTVVLSGGGAPEERFEAAAPLVPGIFRPVATPVHTGPWQLTLLMACGHCPTPGRRDRCRLTGISREPRPFESRTCRTGTKAPGGSL
jgi:hypothetical protein